MPTVTDKFRRKRLRIALVQVGDLVEDFGHFGKKEDGSPSEATGNLMKLEVSARTLPETVFHYELEDGRRLRVAVSPKDKLQ